MLGNGTADQKSSIAHKHVFGDITNIAQAERQRNFAVASEPPEIRYLREQAVRESQELIAQATKKAEADREIAMAAGAEDGYIQGYEAGLAKARLELDEFKAQYTSEMEEFIDSLAEDRRQMWLRMENEIGTLVMKIVRKVVKDEAEINRDIALSTVRAALRRVTDSDKVRVRVNLADLDYVRAAKEDLLELIECSRNIEIISDRRVDPGGCIVESDCGVIDSKLDAQIAAIESEFVHHQLMAA